jgi:hypothetical protein
MDTDAAAYITNVETADGQALEETTKIAIDNFVIGCKQDGIWNAIKASCILAGARTRLGALTPLVGTAPTPFSFVDGDYNRKTGLKGDGSTKYLNSNYASTLLNNGHIAAYATEIFTVAPSGQGPMIIGTRDTGVTNSILYQDNTDAYFSINASIQTQFPGQLSWVNGFRGVERSSSTNESARIVNISKTRSLSTNSLITTTFYVFALNRANVALSHANYRISFYSLGETLNLIALESRVNDLMTAIGSAF